jgi:acetyltransferase-like isoleucine patch superfamily enzyme
MQEYKNLDKNVHIVADELVIGDNVQFGRDIKINVRGRFEIGENSIIGDRFTANAEELIIGKYFYNGPTDSRGMVIGGGGSSFPYAKLKIGDRVVCHTGHINLASPITIGNDVGLSHDVDLITHGFWYSVLEGYPRVFKEINIGNNVIIGWKTVIMSGIDIADNIVVGSHSTVTKSLLESKAIYAGAPAKLIKHIQEPSLEEKIKLLQSMVDDFTQLLSYYDVPQYKVDINYPLLNINQLQINVEDFTCEGIHDSVTDAFRDFARRYGIRVFVSHGFKFNLIRK